MEEVRRPAVLDPGGEVVETFSFENESALRGLVNRFEDRSEWSFNEARTPNQQLDAQARAETWGRASRELLATIEHVEESIRQLVLEAEAHGSELYQTGCRVAAGVLGMEEGYDPETRKKRKIARDQGVRL